MSQNCPPHYIAKKRVAGIERGTEWIEVIEAYAGPEAVRDYLQVELMTKALRLFTRSETRKTDLVKIVQAAEALARLEARLERTQYEIDEIED